MQLRNGGYTHKGEYQGERVGVTESGTTCRVFESSFRENIPLLLLENDFIFLFFIAKHTSDCIILLLFPTLRDLIT